MKCPNCNCELEISLKKAANPVAIETPKTNETVKKLPAFDKNVIIPDEIYWNTSLITEQQIQDFLDLKQSVLAKMVVSGRSVAKIIYEESVKNGISPIVTMARLDTEQSLVSRKTATQGILDWALGVGCPNRTTRIKEYQGIDKQLEGGIPRLAKHYLTSKSFLNNGPLPKKMIVENHADDGRKIEINPQTKAAYILYTYNPEVGVSEHGEEITGNYVFYTIFKKFYEALVKE